MTTVTDAPSARTDSGAVPTPRPTRDRHGEPPHPDGTAADGAAPGTASTSPQERRRSAAPKADVGSGSPPDPSGDSPPAQETAPDHEARGDARGDQDDRSGWGDVAPASPSPGRSTRTQPLVPDADGDERDELAALVIEEPGEATRTRPTEAPTTDGSRPWPDTVVIELRMAPTPRPVPRLTLPQVLPASAATPRPAPASLSPTAPDSRPDRRGHVAPSIERLGQNLVPTYRHRGPGAPLALLDQPVPGVTPGPPGDVDPRQAACVLATSAVEVISGSRPLAQLARWVTPAIYLALEQRRRLSRPADGPDPDPVLPRMRPSAVGRATVRRVRTVRVAEDVVESAVVLGHADRVRAVAIRLVARNGSWRAEALVVG